MNGMLVEAGAAATIGLGLVALRSLRGPEKTAVEAAHTRMFAKSPFNRMVDNLRDLGQPDRLREFVDAAEEFLVIVQAYERGTVGGHAQFVANRKAHELSVIVRRMIDAAKGSRNMTVVDAAVVCETEELPLIRTTCENALQNMLLRERSF